MSSWHPGTSLNIGMDATCWEEPFIRTTWLSCPQILAPGWVLQQQPLSPQPELCPRVQPQVLTVFSFSSATSLQGSPQSRAAEDQQQFRVFEG